MQYFYLCFVLFFLDAFASPIQHWEEGLKAAKQERHTEAVCHYGAAIQEDTEEKCYFIRQDRAIAYMFLEKYQEALADIDYLLSKDLKISEKINAFRLKFSALVYLDRKEEAKKNFEEADELDSQSIILEKYGNTVVVRNMSSCKCFQTIMENVYEKIGWCSKKEDIRKYPRGIWIMNYKPCCEDCGKMDTDENHSGSMSYLQQNFEARDTTPGERDRNTGKEIARCEDACNMAFNYAVNMCSAWYRSPSCVAICLGVCGSLHKLCHSCCSTGDFYEKCIKPFEFIKDMIKCPNDPAWDD